MGAQARNSELQGQLKQKDRKGSHERVYQERDELLGHLQKSYLAFKEKHGENEELKKIIQELKLSQEARAQVCVCSCKFEACWYICVLFHIDRAV